MKNPLTMGNNLNTKMTEMVRMKYLYHFFEGRTHETDKKF